MSDEMQDITFYHGRSKYEVTGTLIGFDMTTPGLWGTNATVKLEIIGTVTRTQLPPIHSCPNCECR